MSARETVPARTRAQQARVSDPTVSAWVSANAGAGKTTVLVRRVIRLLLAGVPPARILCLTFTKAAAANMANKVLETLEEWVRLDDRALDRAIREVSPLSPTPELRARARRLFAQALETPGGLKVQTIHAFCDRVLHQFPFEARVPAGFEVLDEIGERDRIARAQRSVLTEAAEKPQGALGRALAHAVAVASDASLDEALTEAVRERRKVWRLAQPDGTAAVATALGLGPRDSVATVEAEILASPHLPPGQWLAAADVLRSGARTEQELGERIKAAAEAPAAQRVATYLKVFLRQDGERRSRARFVTKAFATEHPDLADQLDREFARMSDLIDKHRAARACERTEALLLLAAAAIDRYEHAKRAAGALDYADLIDKTGAMFDDVAASWVLYKLDGGIDHVLIDEAQDTSPEQWNVIARLTAEFFAGKGAREERSRTVFAVGDEKQSIFSFQGADPREFERMRREFERRATAIGARFEREQLDLSFRSAPGVLKAIDRVFARPEAFRGLSSGEDLKTAHVAIRKRAPALVEIWPTEKPADDVDDELAWDAPLDARSEASPPVRLAQRIARAVTHWVNGGLPVADRKTGKLRAVRPGDVIVLVRDRRASGPFEPILQALKRAGLPVAGADRLKLTEHIAVMDLMALGDALTLAADDLALACALKSPLFGLSEKELFELAHGRGGTLAAALAEKAKNDSRFAAAAERLARWRAEAGGLRPFDFYARVLGRDRGRARMLARLGVEAQDALDEFLARALAYEKTESPSLAGFLSFLRRSVTEVKRDLEVESEAVRVMTVHGAKGLEAPVVVLADTTSMPDGRHDSNLLALPARNPRPGGADALVWALGQNRDSDVMQIAREAARELREAEYRRLLYVALTRAADALVVCGHETRQQAKSELPAGCWYRLVHDALKGPERKPELVETDVFYADGKVWRWRPEALPATIASGAAPNATIGLPAWIGTPAPAPPPPPRRIVPSAFDPDDEPVSPYAPHAAGLLDARRRGDLLHRLLQLLPGLAAADRRDAAARFLTNAAGDAPTDARKALAEEALHVIEHPDLTEVFGPMSRAEVEILARLGEPPAREISGRIDRLAVTPEAVLIVDFKTGEPPDAGNVPAAYVTQLAIYRDVIGRIYPGRAMRVMLVWTAGPAVQEIAGPTLDAALRRVISP